jgi:hypothetical protein
MVLIWAPPYEATRVSEMSVIRRLFRLLFHPFGNWGHGKLTLGLFPPGPQFGSRFCPYRYTVSQFTVHHPNCKPILNYERIYLGI